MKICGAGQVQIGFNLARKVFLLYRKPLLSLIGPCTRSSFSVDLSHKDIKVDKMPPGCYPRHRKTLRNENEEATSEYDRTMEHFTNRNDKDWQNEFSL